MAKVNITNILIPNEPMAFESPFMIHIFYEIVEPINKSIDW